MRRDGSLQECFGPRHHGLDPIRSRRSFGPLFAQFEVVPWCCNGDQSGSAGDLGRGRISCEWGWVEVNHGKPLMLGPIKMSTQDCVHEIGLRDVELSGSPPNEFLVFVCDDELLVFLWEGPGAYVAVQRASLAGVALYVVALRAERLPIAKLIRAVAGARYPVIGAQLYVRFLFSAGRAPETIFLLECDPIFLVQLCPGLTLLAHIQVLQLVARAFLNDRGEAFFALQFAHATENVLIGLLVLCTTKGIDGRTNVVLAQNRSRDSVPDRPKRLQDYCVIELIRRARRDKAGLRIGTPLLPADLRFVRRGPRFDDKPLAGARFSHFAMRH